MADPAIPYDITSLNGVTFNDDQLSFGLSGHGPGPEIDPSNTDTAAGYTAVEYINSIGSTQFSSLKVTGVDQFYTAAHENNGNYYLPTFGTITFNNSIGGQNTFYVHGFEVGGGGLIFSAKEDLSFSSYDYVDYAYSSQYIGILSNTDLGAGPSSPAYAPRATPTNPESHNGYTDSDGVYHYQGSSYNALGHRYYDFDSNTAPDGNPNPPSYPLIFGPDGSQYAPPCYAEGSRILTIRGEVAVEDLEVGDEAVTASGGVRPVIWIGARQVRPMSRPNPAQLNPVRIRKGAFGENLPHSDLVVSPGHAVFVDGVLIPAHALVNGATVIQEAVERVRYFHVELDAHDVLVAEGLPCESYLDDGNRTTFGNSPEFTALHGRLDPKTWEHACAPMVAGGPQLADVQRRLLARAEEMGWTRVEAADLRLLADGVAVAPVMAKGNRYWFAAPAAAELALASTASVLAHALPGVTDMRRLGVAVSELKIDSQALDLAGETFGHGFHAVETRDGFAWRWTDGEGRLALTLAEPAILEVALLMVAPTWKRPATKLRLVEAG